MTEYERLLALHMQIDKAYERLDEAFDLYTQCPTQTLAGIYKTDLKGFAKAVEIIASGIENTERKEENK